MVSRSTSPPDAEAETAPIGIESMTAAPRPAAINSSVLGKRSNTTSNRQDAAARGCFRSPEWPMSPAKRRNCVAIGWSRPICWAKAALCASVELSEASAQRIAHQPGHD